MSHGLSCSAACRIFMVQGSNPSPLHWQADFYPLCHQGSLALAFLIKIFWMLRGSSRRRASVINVLPWGSSTLSPTKSDCSGVQSSWESLHFTPEAKHTGPFGFKCYVATDNRYKTNVGGDPTTKKTGRCDKASRIWHSPFYSSMKPMSSFSE